MNLNNFIQTSIFHDTRRLKNNGKYPVKLRVYIKQKRKTKLFNTAVDLSIEEYNNIWVKANHKKLRGKNRKLHQTFIDILDKADEIIEQMDAFDFDTFEKKLMANISENSSIQLVYTEKMNQLTENKAYSTKETYIYSLKSLEAFSELCYKKPLSFELITVEWLKKYERHMVDTGKSAATIGVYLRPLKAIFNMAVEKEIISNNRYPFGKNKYSIPSSKKVKKALSQNE